MAQPIFLGYDREALDREYDNRKKVIDSPAWLTRFAEESTAARAEIPCRLDVPYGTHPSERLDIFPAEPATPAPVHVTISGDSAGGHLVAMLLATDWAAVAGVPADVVKAGTGISGLYDLEPIRLSYLNDMLALTRDDARGNSPMYLTPKHAAPLLLPLGAREGREYHRQSEEMAAAWHRHGGRADVLSLEGHDHFSIVWELGLRDSALSSTVRGLI